MEKPAKYGGRPVCEKPLPSIDDTGTAAVHAALAAVGHLRFRDLLAVAPTCVAGLDMVPIPSTVEDGVLKWVMRDLDAVHKLKARTLGIRVLLVDAESGKEVDLGMFGITPILDSLL